MFRLSGTEMWQVVTSAFCQLQALTLRASSTRYPSKSNDPFDQWVLDTNTIVAFPACGGVSPPYVDDVLERTLAR